MTPAQLKAAKQKIREHYRLSREVTEAEVRAEIANLVRKRGNYDLLDGHLAAMLVVGESPIDLESEES